MRAEGDYASSRVSTDRRQVAWLLSAAERKALPIDVLRRLRRLEWEENLARKQLPGSISKLVNGYEVRMWWFEIFECVRKLAVACLPVFFQPSGSPSQLVWGLVVCFVAFGLYVHFDPYEERGDNAVAALCQVQIFFSLLASVALTSDSGAVGTNMDVLLVVLYFFPVGLAIFLESPMLPCYQRAVQRLFGRREQRPEGEVARDTEMKELQVTPHRSKCNSNEDPEDSRGPHAASLWGGTQPWLRIANLSPPLRRNAAPQRKNEFVTAMEGGRGNCSKKPVRISVGARYSTSVSSISPAPPEVLVEDLLGAANTPDRDRSDAACAPRDGAA